MSSLQKTKGADPVRQDAPPRARLRSRSGATVEVRRLRSGDGPALQRFNASLDDTTRSIFLPHDYGDATVSRIIERSERGLDRTYVGFTGNEIVLYGFLWHMDQSVPVLGIGLVPKWQGQGLGVQLMNLLIEDAREAGRNGIQLTTVPENKRAHELYQRFGFQHVRDVDNLAGDGRVVREHAMFLPLRPGAQPPLDDFKPPVG